MNQPTKITAATPPQLRTIPGFPLYAISEAGQVWSSISDRYIKSFPDKLGYPRIRLSISRGGEKDTVFIHCLVAAAWIGPRPEGLDCAHLDGNTGNSHASNLAYVTRKENMAHTVIHGTRTLGERTASSKLKEHEAQEIINSDTPAVEMAKRFGISPSHVREIRYGNKWKHLQKAS